MLRKLCVSSVLAVLLLVSVGMSLAAAAPTNAKNSSSLSLDCGAAGTYSVVVNGNGALTPGHVLAGNGVNLIPVALDITGTYQGQTVFTQMTAKHGTMTGRQDQVVQCSVTGTIMSADVTGTVAAVVVPVGNAS